MITIDEIKKNINTDFSKILNQYDDFLEKSKDSSFVLNDDAMKIEVENFIASIKASGIKRIPYDSITTRVVDFNAKSEEEDGLSESFDFLLDQTKSVLSIIIDSLLKEKIFRGKAVSSGEVTAYNDAIVAFYKLLEHTKLADSQYQTLYQKTENEVNNLIDGLNKSAAELEAIKNQVDQFKSMGKLLEETEKRVESIKTEVETQSKDTSKELKKIKETKSSIYTDLIAILGVFSAFVFVMFGGIEVARAVFDIGDDLTDLNLSRVITISSLMLMGILILMYSLLLWIARITGKDFGNCYSKRCKDGCQHKWMHLFMRHSFFFAMLILLSLTTVVSHIYF